MKVLRSWPAVVPDGRCYVVDTTPRLVMEDYDYRCLADVDDDLILIEWDLAVEKVQFTEFADLARANPDDVLVAPYRIYAPTSRRSELAKPFWCHRRYQPGEQSMRFIDETDETCHLFGMGLIYLPREIVRAYLAAWGHEHFNDGTFSGWHHRNVKQETPVAWNVRPVHLHHLTDRK